MEYPSDFPQEAQAAVEAAKIRAGFDLDEAGRTTYYGFPTPEQMNRYIMAVVLAFGREACELGFERRIPMGPGAWAVFKAWSVVRIEKETRDFLQRFAVEAYLEKKRESIITSSGNIEQGIWNGFLESAEWQSFQESRLIVADAQANPSLYDTKPTLPRGESLLPVGLYQKSDTAKEIEKLRAECRITLEELAEETGFDQSTIHRHESGRSTPQPWRISKYEKIFSKLLRRDVVIPVTPIKRK